MKSTLYKHISLFFVVLFVSSSAILAQAQEGVDTTEVEVTSYKKGEIIPFLTTLQQWYVRAFGKPPYSYLPSEDYIVNALDVIFVNAREAMVALARKEGKVVGMTALIPFDNPEMHMFIGQPDLPERMQKAGFDSSQILYAVYFLTAPEYHNDEQIVYALYKTITDYARSLGKTHICYLDFPRLPSAEESVEPWGVVIDQFKNTGVDVPLSWPTKKGTTVQEIAYILEFYVKNLEE